MSLKLTSITLNTPHLEDMLKFYRIVGLVFVETKVDKGGAVYRATFDGFEFSIRALNTPERVKIPLLQLSFSLPSLPEKVRQLSQVNNAMCILDPTDMPDGKKAIMLDPDGHSIELKEI